MKKALEYFGVEWIALEVLTAVTVATFAMIAYAVLNSTAIA
jgi:hypothetical protein